MKRIGQRILVLILFLIPAPASWADVVELKTGQRVEGTFKQATTPGVVIEVAGQEITFPPEKVRAIYFGAMPSPTPAQSSVLQEALRALKALRSVTEGSVNYRDYAPRVNDTKIVVDRYLQDPTHGDDGVKNALSTAMGYYLLASSAWNAKITATAEGYVRVGLNPLLRQCPQVQQAMARVPRKERPIGLSPITSEGIMVAESGIPALWSCASDKITEA